MSRRKDNEEGTVEKNLKGHEKMDEGYNETKGGRIK